MGLSNADNRLFLVLIREPRHLRRVKLSRRSAVREQQIQLFVRPALGLRQPEEGPDEHNQRSRTPHKTSVAPQVELARVHKVWLDDLRYDSDNVVGIAGENDCLLAEARGSNLCRDSPPKLADRQLENKGPRERQDGLSHCDGLAGGPDVEDTDDEEGSE